MKHLTLVRSKEFHRGASSALFSYGLAVLSVVLLALLRLLLEPVIGNRLYYSFFFAAIMISLLYGGLGPAVLAMVLGFLAGCWVFSLHVASLDYLGFSAPLHAMIYFMLSIILIAGSQTIRNRSIALIARKRELEKEVQEREKVEQQLHRQVQELEAMYEGSPIGIALFDRDMRYLRMNPALERINGIPHDRTLGRTISEVLGGLAEHIEPIFRRVIDSGQPLVTELHQGSIRPSDGPRSFWLALHPLLEPNGRVRAVSCIVEETTERERAEAINAHLAAIVQCSSEAIISTNFDGAITTWNPGAEQMFGYSAAEVAGRNASLLTPDHIKGEFTELRSRVLQGEPLVGWETVRQRKDGTLVDVVLSASCLESPDGRVLGTTALFQNITRRKQAEQTLREKEARLSLAVGLARMGMWDLELPKGPFYASDRCLEIFGAKRDEVDDCAKYWRKSLHPADRDRISAALAKSLQEQSIYEVEYRIVWRDGSIHWVSAKGKILRDEKGKPFRLLGVATDITGRKNAEEALRRSQEQLSQKNQELEQKVQERTGRLQEALTDLEQFSYSIVHDLRAPLRTMSQYAYLVQAQSGEKLDPMSKDFLKQITAGAGRADQLIQDVLAYSRVARGELKLSPVDLASVVRQVVQAYPSLQPSQAEIEIQVPSTFVLANAAALTQCVSNLLCNAAKFVAPGVRPRIRIRAEPKGNQTRLSIQDNGIGIEKAYLDRIWGVFERAATDNRYEGTGIGLSIVRKAIERMGGAVGVESEPGRGSTFWFQLKNAPFDA